MKMKKLTIATAITLSIMAANVSASTSSKVPPPNAFQAKSITAGFQSWINSFTKFFDFG